MTGSDLTSQPRPRGGVPVWLPPLPVAAGTVAAALLVAWSAAEYARALASVGARGTDFAQYYVAARMTLSHGWAAPYDVAGFMSTLHALTGARDAYANLPAPTALAIPLTRLPLGPAYAVWNTVLVGGFAAASWAAAGGRGWERVLQLLAGLAAFQVLSAVGLGQLALAAGALVVLHWWLLRGCADGQRREIRRPGGPDPGAVRPGGDPLRTAGCAYGVLPTEDRGSQPRRWAAWAAEIRRCLSAHPLSGRPVLAGVALGLAFVKPQDVFLVPLALLMAGRTRAALAGLAAGAAVGGACLAVLCPDGLHRYLQTVAFEMDHMQAGRYTVAAALGGGVPARALAVAPALLVALLAAVAGRRARDRGPERPIVAGVLASQLATPYLNGADLALLVPCAWLTLRSRPPRWVAWVAVGVNFVPFLQDEPLRIVTVGLQLVWLGALALWRPRVE